MKKLWLAIGTGLVAGGIGTGIYFANTRFTKNTPLPQQAPQEASTKTALLTWHDPAGFTFQYPDGVTIDKHDEDQQNYAHVEITNKDHLGNVIVWAKDTTAADVTAWVRTEKRFKNANILDTTLGEKPAKKILLSSPSAIIVGTIGDAILFTVESELDSDGFWNKVHDTIIKSFAFVPLTGEKSNNNSAGGSANDGSSVGDGGSVDEEVVVE